MGEIVTIPGPKHRVCEEDDACKHEPTKFHRCDEWRYSESETPGRFIKMKRGIPRMVGWVVKYEKLRKWGWGVGIDVARLVWRNYQKV